MASENIESRWVRQTSEAPIFTSIQKQSMDRVDHLGGIGFSFPSKVVMRPNTQENTHGVQ